MEKVMPCLWCDGNAEEMAAFYTSLLPDSSIDAITHSPADNPSVKAVVVLTVEFTLAGRPFVALNGGPYFTFNEAVSFQIDCKDQGEVDRLWVALSAHPADEQCGWLKDRYGLSWQIVPRALKRMIADPDRDAAKRAMDAMLTMKKLDVAQLEAAFNGH